LHNTRLAAPIHPSIYFYLTIEELARRVTRCLTSLDVCKLENWERQQRHAGSEVSHELRDDCFASSRVKNDLEQEVLDI
jgi:hypothetical protein